MISVQELFAIRSRIWAYAPDPIDQVEGPTIDEATQRVLASKPTSGAAATKATSKNSSPTP
jgi:hypothetical protein